MRAIAMGKEASEGGEATERRGEAREATRAKEPNKPKESKFVIGRDSVRAERTQPMQRYEYPNGRMSIQKLQREHRFFPWEG